MTTFTLTTIGPDGEEHNQPLTVQDGDKLLLTPPPGATWEEIDSFMRDADVAFTHHETKLIVVPPGWTMQVLRIGGDAL